MELHFVILISTINFGLAMICTAVSLFMFFKVLNKEEPEEKEIKLPVSAPIIRDLPSSASTSSHIKRKPIIMDDAKALQIEKEDREKRTRAMD